MTDNQKFIKYLAIGLAIFLIILIVVGVIGAFTTLGVLFGGVKNEPQKNGDMYVYSDFQNTVNLDAMIKTGTNNSPNSSIHTGSIAAAC